MYCGYNCNTVIHEKSIAFLSDFTKTRNVQRRIKKGEFVMGESKNEMQKREILRLSNEESNRLTRECLQTALIYLMKEKPFDKISITEIVKRSGVSRTAFYRNYGSKEDILNEIGNEITNAIYTSFSSDFAENDPYEWYRMVFEKIRMNKEEFALLLQADMINRVFDSAIKKLRRVSLDINERYRFEAVFGAHTAITVEWFRNGLAESDEQMAQICTDIRLALNK